MTLVTYFYDCDHIKRDEPCSEFLTVFVSKRQHGLKLGVASTNTTSAEDGPDARGKSLVAAPAFDGSVTRSYCKDPEGLRRAHRQELFADVDHHRLPRAEIS